MSVHFISDLLQGAVPVGEGGKNPGNFLEIFLL